jgi:hypothetical protein
VDAIIAQPFCWQHQHGGRLTIFSTTSDFDGFPESSFPSVLSELPFNVRDWVAVGAVVDSRFGGVWNHPL